MAILHVSQHYPKHASSHRDILHAPGAPRELYHSTGAICCTCLASVHSESMRRPFPIHIRSGGFPLLCFNSDHHLLIHGYTMWIMRCAASCLDSLSSVQIVCIKLFPAEYNASARCFLVTVSSSGSSGALKQSHIVWKHQSWSEWKWDIAAASRLNAILAVITICQPWQSRVSFRWDSTIIPKSLSTVGDFAVAWSFRSGC